MSPKEVLTEICRYESMNLKQLAESAYLSPTQLYDIRKGKIKTISDRVARKLVQFNGKYSIDWIMTGEGPIFRDGSTELPHIKTKTEKELRLEVKMYKDKAENYELLFNQMLRNFKELMEKSQKKDQIIGELRSRVQELAEKVIKARI